MKNPSEIVRQTYNTIAEHYDTWAASVRVRERHTYVKKILNSFQQGSKLLDIGCGSGVLLTACLSEKYEMVGVDISERQIKEARQRYPSIQFMCADIGTFQCEPESFDGIVSFYCFNHIPRDSYKTIFLKLFNWLKPNGLMIASFGTGDTEGWIGEWLGAETFFSSYNQEQTVSIIRSAGFKIEEESVETALENGAEIKFLWITARKQ